MFYYIDQPSTPSFPNGLVKTESYVIVGVDAYPLLAFSDLTCYLEDIGIGVFWLHYAA